MPAAKGQYPLATVLFGCAPAPACAQAPDDSAPETWRANFAEQAGAEVFAGLFRASKSTRDSALQWAPQMTLRLDLTSDEQHDVWVQRLEAVADRLRTRGGKPIALHITCSHGLFATSLLSVMPQALQGVGAGITQLSVVFPPAHRGYDARVQTLFLQRIAAALPSLTSLSLEHCPCTLPLPSALPSLTAISITAPPTNTAYEALYISVGAYMPQLQQLHIPPIPQYHNNPVPIPWPSIFTHTSHTLTQLTHTKGYLYDGLITLLVNHAPALQQISVRGIHCVADHSARQWAVTRVSIVDASIMLAFLAGLPTSSAGSVEVVGVSQLLLDPSPTGGTKMLAPGTVLRLPDWRFPDPVDIQFYYLEDLTDPPSTLTTLLRHMADIQAPTVTLRVHTPVWTAELSQAAAAVLAALPQLRLDLSLHGKLTDESLSALLHAGSHVRKLSLTQLSLGSDTHANTLWPWEAFTVSTVNPLMLLRLPSPSSSPEGSAVVKCEKIVLDEITQADAEPLIKRLPQFKLGPKTRGGISVSLTWPGALALAEARLSVLRAVQFDSDTAARSSRLELHKWPMEKATIEALHGLPAWAGQLCFTKCTWPLKASSHHLQATEYQRLGQAIPTSYQVWCAPKAPAAVLQSMCAAASGVRAGLGVPRLVVHSFGRLGEDEVWDNVTLTGGWPQAVTSV